MTEQKQKIHLPFLQFFQDSFPFSTPHMLAKIKYSHHYTHSSRILQNIFDRLKRKKTTVTNQQQTLKNNRVKKQINKKKNSAILNFFHFFFCSILFCVFIHSFILPLHNQLMFANRTTEI